MMRPCGFLLVAGLAAWHAVADDANAQMFGKRTMGSVLSQDRLGSSAGTGMLNFNERFIRGNRRSGNFVGTDSRDSRGFVGSQQGGERGRARSATSGLRIQSAPDANRTASASIQRRSGPYQPQLSLGFETTRPSEQSAAEMLLAQLESLPGFHPTGPIEVLVEGGKATLRGEVASERDRSLAERLALFEPGIDAVRNELKVRPAPAGAKPYRTPESPSPAPKAPAK